MRMLGALGALGALEALGVLGALGALGRWGGVVVGRPPHHAHTRNVAIAA